MSNKETKAQEIERLQKENEALRLKAEQNANIGIDPGMSKYMTDLNYLEKVKTQRSGANKITVKEVTDHKNTSLWTKWGKRVGPLHPHNLEVTYKRFYTEAQAKKRPWMYLLVQQPSPQEVENWKKSEEGQAYQAHIDAERKRKIKSRRKGEVDKLIDAMKHTYGLRPDQINAVKDPSEVGGQPVDAGA